ncbi:MAG: polysaccharide biosynthesis/export family protein [Mesorhizobium sp.]
MKKAKDLTLIPQRARILFAVAVLLAAAPLQALSATTDEYRLGTMDKLRVRVAEWQSAEGAFRDWSAVSGDYSVGPAGTISVPFVGELPVTGKTTAEVATAIGDGLQQKLGLPDRPEASVELAEFRPIFVSGDVQTPGRYPYDPQLTVLKALSIAGGLRRSESGQGGARDFITAQGNYDVMAAQRDGLLARKARLEAEAANKPQIDFPPELNKTAAGKKLMADETSLMQARQKRLRLQLESLDNLKALLQSEIESLEKKITTQTRQTDLAREELKGIDNLAGKGLVVNQRVLTLEQTIAELESKLLDMDTAILRAKQDIAKATQDAISLQNDRDTEIAQDRQQTEADLDTMNLKMGMYSGLMVEALERAPDAARNAGGRNPPQMSFSIVRNAGDGKAGVIAADENTPVLPGDVVKVEIAQPAANSN